MRYRFCALMLGGWVMASSMMADGQSSVSQNSARATGSFYVDGIVYQYAVGNESTVVVAAHSVINHKFLGVKVRVYNTGRHSVTVKPEDLAVEDAAGGHRVDPISAAELAKRMRRPQNMARYSVGAIAGDSMDSPVTSDMVTPQFMEMMRAMGMRTNGAGGSSAAGRNLLYTDTPGALDGHDATSSPAAECDEVCRLRMREAAGVDTLAQLQRSISPAYVEQCGFLANTIPPHANVGGLFYYPLGKLAEVQGESKKAKSRLARVTLPIDGESFQFVLPVE